MSNKLCFYTKPFPGIKSYYDMIDAAAEYQLYAVEGLNHFELEIPDIEEAKKIREYADKKHVVFPCFSAFVQFAAERDTVKRLKAYAEVAKILGSPYLHHTIVGECKAPDKVMPYKEELFAKGTQAVREVYDYAESIGIKAIYEEQGYIFNGVKEFGRFLEQVDRNVGVVADLGNIYQSGDDVIAFIKAHGNRVVHVHIKDVTLTDANPTGGGLKTLAGKYMHPAEVGAGDVKIKEAIRLLENMGYDGYYGLEITLDDANPEYIQKSIQQIKALF